MQKLLAGMASLAAVAALCGCATDSASSSSEPALAREYTTGSRLPVRAGSRVDTAKLTEADREEIRRMSNAAMDSSRMLVPTDK